MIPYFEWTTIEVGPVTLYVWGLFVGLGILFGSAVAGWRARKLGQNDKIIYDLTFILAIAGVIGARLGHILFYDPAPFLANPLSAFAIWDGGMSIMGSFLLCAPVAILYLRKRQVDPHAYLDTTFFGLPFGYFVGRIGCFLIHDHPGTATDFILGVRYPDGVVRHDLGLYLSLNGLVLAGIFLFLAKKRLPNGFFIATFMAWYGAVRFFLDFLRIADVRYLGLTPAQYVCAPLCFGGIALLIYLARTYGRKERIF